MQLFEKNIGAAVATNLIAKNYKVEIVMDKDQNACSRFKQCQVAKTPQEVTEKSDIVISGECQDIILSDVVCKQTC